LLPAKVRLRPMEAAAEVPVPEGWVCGAIMARLP
jgi:hypothetical protein